MAQEKTIKKYDVIVIGGGIAGINTAITAVAAGFKTVIFERNKLGGLSFYGGDLLMKKLYDAALNFNRADAIISDKKIDFTFDLTTVLAEMNDVRKNHLDHFIGTFIEHQKLEVIQAEARLISRHEVIANGESYYGKFIVLATGSKLRKLADTDYQKAFEQDFLVRANEVERLTSLPKSLVVIGGGTIAFELAVLFSLIGTKVTLLARNEFLRMLDEELREKYFELIENENLTLHRDSLITELGDNKVTFNQNGTFHTINADKVILAIGFEPQVIKIPGEELAYNENGIIVNEYLQTSIPNIYAVGNSNAFDAKSTIALTEGVIAVNSMMGQKKPIDFSKFAHTIIGKYQYGSFGKTEEMIKAENIPYIRKSLRADNEKTNEQKLHFLKLLIHKHTLAVLGVHLIGENAVQQLNIILDLLEDNDPFKLDNRYNFTDDAYVAGNLTKQALIAMNLKIINEDFASYYQAKINLENNEIIGAESLGRFKVDNNFTNPLPFITAFEKNGYIADLDLKSLENACLLLLDLEKAGLNDKNFTVSINVSPYTLTKVAVSRFQEIIEKHHVRPEQIMLEVTERATGENLKFLRELNLLRNYGFKISMDDFSAGHSSLTLFNTFKFDEIKIDMGVLPKDADDIEAQNVYKNLVSVLKNKNSTIVAEGIEEKFHHDFLLSVGIKEGQGYYFARPQSKEDFISSLSAKRADK